LKAHSDCLVYVEYGLPYWAYKNPEDEREAFRTAAIPPACVYCDLYIAYSNEVAASIKLLLLLNKNKTGTESKRQADEKAVALGSPKFDKVLRSKRENHALPKEWSKLIAGARRKIILFNTSIGSALKDTEAYLQRLRDLLGLFKSADDVVLWWRPHPLLQSTFDSMRAGLSGAYRAIVKEYRRGAWGIYDDTEDLYRAIAWSDAYYGDESSLIYLYLATGKPFALTTVLFDANGDFLTEGLTDFRTALQWQINNMKNCKGGNIGNWNICIWWHNFSSNEKVEDFLRLFLHYVLHTDEYPEAEEYKRLKLQMFHDFVTNSDGTAGQKIYDCCKNKVLK
jgi:hypothetical protein